jgi:transposase-like protein
MPTGKYNRKTAKIKHKYVKHSPQEKAAVLAALLAGQGLTETAEKYNVTVSQVAFWKKDLTSDQIRDIQNKNREEFESLIYEFVKEALITMSCQVRFFRTIEYLKGQSAAELATLFGVTTDKVVRLLAANQAAIEAATAGRVDEAHQLETSGGTSDLSI